jgi:hypothetical protein
VERKRSRNETKEPEEQVKPKKKKREPKTKLQKKCGSKKGRPKEENIIKKQVSLPSNALIRHPSKVSNKSYKPNRCRCCCPANRA